MMQNEEKHRMTIAMRLSNRTTYITKYHPTLTVHNKSLQQQLQASAESVKEGVLFFFAIAYCYIS